MSADWSQVRRILCVRLDNMGDVLMSSPAIRALREADPERRITLLASPSGAAIASYLEGVDEVVTYHAPWVKNDATHGPDFDLAMIERLRAGRFDAAVIFTVYSQSALPAAMMCRLAGIPRVLAHSRENPYRLISEWVREGGPLDGGRHEVQRQLDLVAHVGARADDTRMRVVVPQSAYDSLAATLAALGVPEAAGWTLVHPGATAASRRYPPERFARAIAALPADVTVLVTGGPDEHDLAQEVCQRAGRGVSLAGRLSLGELVALVSRAGVLVSNNSGPVHIAAATGTPVVDLYALTNPQHTPWQVESRVLFQDVPCKNCYRSICPEGHHACLLGVPPEAVAAAATELGTARTTPVLRVDRTELAA